MKIPYIQQVEIRLIYQTGSLPNEYILELVVTNTVRLSEHLIILGNALLSISWECPLIGYK